MKTLERSLHLTFTDTIIRIDNDNKTIVHEKDKGNILRIVVMSLQTIEGTFPKMAG
jgi:hypothetical protein